jgi:hypothetical protein
MPVAQRGLDQSRLPPSAELRGRGEHQPPACLRAIVGVALIAVGVSRRRAVTQDAAGRETTSLPPVGADLTRVMHNGAGRHAKMMAL